MPVLAVQPASKQRKEEKNKIKINLEKKKGARNSDDSEETEGVIK